MDGWLCFGVRQEGGFVLERDKQSLELRQEEPDAALELDEVLVRAHVRRLVREGGGEVGAAEDGVLAGLAHADVDADVGGGFFGGAVDGCGD